MTQTKLNERASLEACEEYIFSRLQECDSEAVNAYEALPHQEQDPVIIRIIERCRDMVTNGFMVVTDHNEKPHRFPVSRAERLPEAPKFGSEITRAPIKHGRTWDWPSWL